MPKRITILDPNGVEVATGEATSDSPLTHGHWRATVERACGDLTDLLKREDPKLGTYTVTVREVE